MIDPSRLGRDFRLSIEDFAGQFVEIQPWQRQVLAKIAIDGPEPARSEVEAYAMRPDIRAALNSAGFDVVDDPGRVMGWDLAGKGDLSAMVTMHREGDLLIIDDLIPEAKAFEAERHEFREKMTAKHFELREQSLAARHDPRNRAERRAQAAKARRK